MGEKLQNKPALLLINQVSVKTFIRDMFTEQGLELEFADGWSEAVEMLSKKQYSIFTAYNTSDLITETIHQSILSAAAKSDAKTFLVLNKEELSGISSSENAAKHLYYLKGIRPKLLWIVLRSQLEADAAKTIKVS
jgi:hypothetical protein